MSVSTQEMAALLAGLQSHANGPGRLVRPPIEPLTCSTCREPLDRFHADIGTHPGCDVLPLVPFVSPAPTIGELRHILMDYDANSPRSKQTAIGPSEIATPCDRRLAYALSGTPEQPSGRLKWEAMIGTAVHAVIAKALHEENTRLGRQRWLVEQRVRPDPQIFGSCDAYDTDIDTVIDWKVVGKSSLDKYRRGPGPQYEGQSHLYGRGWQREGRTPVAVRVVFLPRASSFDDGHEWTAAYSRATADSALDRMYSIVERLSEVSAAEIPATPGAACWFCPFLRRGQAADACGCPGDEATDAKRSAKFSEGLIAS
jgi:hypothetical protein